MTDGIHLMDCLEGLRGMDADSVDCIVTSPPYNKKAQKHKVGNQIWGGFRIDYDNYEDAKPEAEYAAWMQSILAECARVLKPDGSLFLNHKCVIENCRANFPNWVFCGGGVYLYQLIIWDRQCAANIRNDTLFPMHEFVFWLVKGKPRVCKSQAQFKSDIWRILPDRENDHPAPFPFALADNCIALSCPNGGNCLVCDPFTGSGTTAVAARSRGHRFVGFEISPAYAKMAEERLAHTVRVGGKVQGDLFE